MRGVYRTGVETEWPLCVCRRAESVSARDAGIFLSRNTWKPREQMNDTMLLSSCNYECEYSIDDNMLR